MKNQSVTQEQIEKIKDIASKAYANNAFRTTRENFLAECYTVAVGEILGVHVILPSIEDPDKEFETP